MPLAKLWNWLKAYFKAQVTRILGSVNYFKTKNLSRSATVRDVLILDQLGKEM